MQSRIRSRLLLSLFMLGISGCTAGLEPPSAHQEAIPTAVNTRLVTGIAVPTNATSSTVKFQVCQDLPDWDRPDLSTQLSELQQNPRYRESLSEEPLKGLAEKFWNQSVITFTTYGLSARVEPIYLSGLWTVVDAIETCYDAPLTEAINQGQLAEMWLIGHRVLDIHWIEGEYSVTVEPSDGGLQLILFERVETDMRLPIVVTAVNGSSMAVASGDW